MKRGMTLIELKVDFSMLIHELRFTHGMTMGDIGQRVSLSRESIRLYYKRDCGPMHLDGERLIALWMITTHKARHEVPMTPIEFSAASVR